MRTLVEARFRLDQMLFERHAAGKPAHVEQIDWDVTETSTAAVTDVLAYVYLAGADPDDLLFVGFQVACPPKLFDLRAVEHALLRCPSDAVH